MIFSIKLSTCLLCLLSLNALQAQNTLVDRFGVEAIASVQGTEKLAILEFQNLHGYAVQDLSGLKDISEHPNALEISSISENTAPLTEDIISSGFELFAYAFPITGKTNRYYRIGETGKLLLIYSMDGVKKKFVQNNSLSK